jgi:hypothetical protein
MVVDLFLVYQFVRRLATPFNQWDAFKLGIIDERGNILRKRRDLRLQQERAAFGVFDVLVLNIKKLIEKLPGGQTRLASYAAALFLIREWNHFTPGSLLNESISDKQLDESIELFSAVITDYILTEENVNQKMHGLDEIFEKRFTEEVPAMNVGSGEIAGLGIGPDGEPGLTRAQQKRYKRRNKNGKKLRDILGKT